MHFVPHIQIPHKEKILTTAITQSKILVSGTSKNLTHYTLPNLHCNVCYIHLKSVRTIAVSKNFFACASYDGNAVLFKNNAIFDIITGPESEIKGIAFSEDNKYFAVTTRAKNVWIYNIHEDGASIDGILENHTQDVKGCKFKDDCFYTYSFDGTVQVYLKEEKWKRTGSIMGDESTIWDIAFLRNYMIVCTHNGNIIFYEREDFTKVKQYNVSKYAIFKLCIIKDFIGFIHNRSNVCVINEDCEVITYLECSDSEINCIYYCKDNGMLICGGDDGEIRVYKNIEN